MKTARSVQSEVWTRLSIEDRKVLLGFFIKNPATIEANVNKEYIELPQLIKSEIIDLLVGYCIEQIE